MRVSRPSWSGSRQQADRAEREQRPAARATAARSAAALEADIGAVSVAHACASAGRADARQAAGAIATKKKQAAPFRTPGICSRSRSMPSSSAATSEPAMRAHAADRDDDQHQHQVLAARSRLERHQFGAEHAAEPGRAPRRPRSSRTARCGSECRAPPPCRCCRPPRAARCRSACALPSSSHSAGDRRRPAAITSRRCAGSVRKPRSTEPRQQRRQRDQLHLRADQRIGGGDQEEGRGRS